MDLISRQAVLDAINSGMLTDDDTQFECPSECNSMLEWAVNAVKELPTAEPRKGKWIHRKNWSMYVCEQCSFESREASRYCPYCGARMEN